MPGFDGTGPHGMGPMTGRGMGYCVVPLSTQQEGLDYLKKQAQVMRGELEQIEVRIRKLENPKSVVSREYAMKIAITATAASLDADIDPRFGRCQYFIIADPDTMEFESLENSGAMAGGGVGIATAQTIAGKGIEAVLTGNCGPNAYQVLAAAGIKVITGVSGKVRQAIEDYKSDKLKASSQPNVPGHFGIGRRNYA